MWSYLAILVISALVSYALSPKPPAPEPPSLDDVDAPVAEEGKPIGVVFGEVVITGPNVVWFGDLGQEPIVKSGGKK